jgi:hypothetical protein
MREFRLSEQVNGGPQRPGSLNLLRLVLDALHQRHIAALLYPEPLRQQRMQEGQVQAQIWRL